MANIEQLNFSLIINESEFDEQIKRVKDKADELNTSITNILGANKKIVPFSDADVKNVENVAKAFKEVAKAEGLAAREAAKTNSRKRTEDAKAEAAAIKEAAKAKGVEARETLKTEIAQERLNRLQKEHTSLLGRSSRLWREMGTMVAAYFSVHGAVSLVRALTRITGEFEMQRITLGAILRDSQAAGEIFEQIKELAVMSPFQFKELVTYTKQLSAFSIPVEELYDTTKMLADVSAGLGVGMDRLVLAYGQIRSASFLRGQEVRQLTEAGIPILEELRKQFVALGEEGITVGDVFDKISRRMVPFEMVEKVFKDMTSEGGKFYQMQEVQAETLKGKISNLTDAYQIMFAEIGDKKSGMLKGAVDMARSLAENYERVGRVLVSLVAAYGAYKAMSTAVVAIHRAELIALKLQITTQEALGKIISKNIAKTAAWKAVMQVAKNPYALVAAGIAAVGTYLVAAHTQAKKFRMELEGIAKSQYRTADESARKFRDLVQQLKGATQGSQNYRDAIAQLNNQYGEYLPNLLSEQNALNELIRLENEVTNAIYARARAYAEVEGTSAIEDKQGKRVNAAIDTIKDRLISAGFSKDAARDIITNFEAAIKESPAADAGGLLTKLLKNQFDGAKQYAEWLEAHNAEYTNLILSAETYAKRVDKLTDAYGDLEDILDFRWGEKGYSSKKERETMEGIIAEYEKYAADIRSQALPEGETQARLRENAIAQLKAMREAYVQLAQEAESDDLAGAWNNKLSEIDKKLEEMGPAAQSWLQSIVNPFATGNNRDLAAQLGESFTEYTGRIRKEWEEVSKAFDDADKSYKGFVKAVEDGTEVDDKALQKSKELRDDYEARKKSIQSIAEAAHFSLTKTSGGGGSVLPSSQDETKDIVNNIQSQIRIYEKLKSTYEGFADSMSDKDKRDMLSLIFPQYGDMVKADFESELGKLVNRMKELSLVSDNAASALMNYFDSVSDEKLRAYTQQVEDAENATERYKELLGEWEGIVPTQGAIGKIVSEYSSALDKIEKLRSDSIKALWEQWKGGIISIDEFARAAADMENRAKAAGAEVLLSSQGSAEKAIEEMFDNWLEKNTDFEHLTDLTISQLNKLKQQIENFSISDLDPKDLEGVKKIQLTKEEIDAIIKKLKERSGGRTDSQIDAKEVKKWLDLAQSILSVAGALEEYAEASNNLQLAGLAKYISFIGDVVGNTLDGLKKGDVLGAVVAAVSTIADYALKAATESARLKAELAEVIHERYLEEIEERVSATETIFGESWIGKIRVLRSGIRGLSKDVSDLVDSGEWLYRPYRPATSFIDALQEFADDLGLALYQENGLFDTTTLEQILANNKYALGKANRETINLIIEDTKKLEELYKDLEESIGSMFNSLGSDIADSLIESLRATGSAVTDLEDVFQGLGDAIFKSMVQSYVIDEVLNKYKDEVMSWWTDETLTEADIATRIRDFAESVKQDIDIADDRISAMYEAFMNNSLLTVSDEADEKSTLGGGLKSITEDTANLLASYVNAIRADVAAIRQAVVAGNTANVPAPTLAEYLTQIQANTYNTAQNTANLLADLRSMMTVTDGPALRVFM